MDLSKLFDHFYAFLFFKLNNSIFYVSLISLFRCSKNTFGVNIIPNWLLAHPRCRQNHQSPLHLCYWAPPREWLTMINGSLRRLFPCPCVWRSGSWAATAAWTSSCTQSSRMIDDQNGSTEKTRFLLQFFRCYIMLTLLTYFKF